MVPQRLAVEPTPVLQVRAAMDILGQLQVMCMVVVVEVDIGELRTTAEPAALEVAVKALVVLAPLYMRL